MNNRIYLFLGVFLGIFAIYQLSGFEPEVEQREITIEDIREAIDLAKTVTGKAEAYYEDFRNLPISNKEAGLPFPNQITSENVKSVTIQGNWISVKFKKHLQKANKFAIRADFSKTTPIEIEWRCVTGNINPAFFEEVYPECMYTDSDVMADLMQAIHQKNITKIDEALDNGADINGQLHGDTPLLAAIVRSSNRPDIAEHLLDNGADIEQGTSRYSQRTPLMVALTNSNREVVQLLIDKGADVNATDAKGKTVLQHVRHSRDFYRKLLIDAGAYDPNQY